MHANPLPAGFDQLLSNYLITTSQAVEAILAVGVAREPERYTKAAELVKIGRLIPQVVSQPGALSISLIDASTGKSIGEVFHYSAPALEACGVPN